MSKSREWYFRGYESVEHVTASGRRIRELVYTGDYYGIQDLTIEQLKKYKIIFSIMYLLGVAVYLTASLWQTGTASSLWVSAPHLLAFFPLIYLGLALGNFLTAEEKWPYRLVRLISERARWICRAIVLLTGVSCMAYCVIVILRWTVVWGDLLYALLLAAEILETMYVLRFQKKHPVIMLPSAPQK